MAPGKLRSGQDKRKFTAGPPWGSAGAPSPGRHGIPPHLLTDAQGVFRPLLQAPCGGAPNRIQIWTASGRHRCNALKFPPGSAPSLTAAPRGASASPPPSPAKTTKTMQNSVPPTAKMSLLAFLLLFGALLIRSGTLVTTSGRKDLICSSQRTTLRPSTLALAASRASPVEGRGRDNAAMRPRLPHPPPNCAVRTKIRQHKQHPCGSLQFAWYRVWYFL